MENIVLSSHSTPELAAQVASLIKDDLLSFFTHNKDLLQQPKTAELPEENYDITEAAAYLNCSIQTIHNKKKDGSLPYYRLGRKVYFKKSEIDACARVVGLQKQKRD